MATKQCTGDCLKCSLQQQVYCAAQRTFAILNNQETILKNQQALSEKISALESSLSPSQEEIIPLDAQNGRGAEENSSPEDNLTN